MNKLKQGNKRLVDNEIRQSNGKIYYDRLIAHNVSPKNALIISGYKPKFTKKEGVSK